MAITSTDIQNQSFSIDRKGYDVDEVDVFLERLSDEVDGLNSQVADLQSQLAEANERADDAEARAAEAKEAAAAAPAVERHEPAAPVVYTETEKDARIATLERQLEERRRDVDAIAQALITAQRSGEEIVANAKKTALGTQQDAEEEAKRILDKANSEKQRVLSTISDLQESREQVRTDYQEMLKEFIQSASKTLTEIGGDLDDHQMASLPRRTTTPRYADTVSSSAADTNVNANDRTDAFAATYTTPQVSHTVAAKAPKESKPGRDLTGFGDADDDFEFDDLD
jgi:cell division initiation protein